MAERSAVAGPGPERVLAQVLHDRRCLAPEVCTAEPSREEWGAVGDLVEALVKAGYVILRQEEVGRG